MTLTPAQARSMWCDELESGKWKQGTGQLARETDHGIEYCCLGVACELAIREGIIEGYDGVDTCLDDPYGAVQRYLASDNDEGATFAEIAATIRDEPEGLITT